jgi:phospholipase/carboxylesterase
MWFFLRYLPPICSLLAPRAPFPLPGGGYSWREFEPDHEGLPSLAQLRPAVDSLLSFLTDWQATFHLGTDRFHLIGFSQGAAMVYALALLNPERVHSMAALSGFLPEGGEQPLELRVLAGKPIFVSHGRQDPMVSVDLARHAVKILQVSGALVTYCESDGGHKIATECLKGMESFFQTIYNQGDPGSRSRSRR